ncbi:MAG: NAD(P)-binding protein [Nocardioidaceae bacterium]
MAAAHPVLDVLVVGDLEAARLTCGALEERGHRTRHLVNPDEVSLRAALFPDVDAVAILVRGDVHALRLALLTEHLRPGVRLVVTIFDRTVSEHLERVVPNSQVTSPAAVSAPMIVAACLGGDEVAVQRTAEDQVVRWLGPPGARGAQAYDAVPGRLRQWAGWLLPRMRWQPGATGLMLAGLAGLLAILLVDWLLAVTVLHEPGVRAFYAAARVLATVGPGGADAHEAPSWYLVVAALFMLAAMGFTAMFTAGLIDWLLSARSVALIGPRRLPSRGHVIVAGLGQVGLRLALSLRRIGVPVVGVEVKADAPGVRVARQQGIPVVVGNAGDRSTLTRVGLTRARALAAMGSDDLDNIEIAIAALGVAPDARVVLRAGEGDVVTETRSLFHIGQVVDVSALTAATAALSLTGHQPRVVFGSDDGCVAVTDDGEITLPRATRCRCSAAPARVAE